MQYKQHNFEQNITGAIKANNHEQVIKVLLSEVGKILSKDKLALVRVVQKSGKQIPDNIKSEDLAKLIVAGIDNANKEFLKNLVETLLLESKKYSEDITGIGSIVSGVGNIVGGIANAVTAPKVERMRLQEAQEGTKQVEMTTRADMFKTLMSAKTQSDALKAQQQSELSGASTTTLIMIGVGTLLVLGFVVVVMSRRASSPAYIAAQAPAVKSA